MLNNIKTYQTSKGFTIVELLIVIVVIAILAAISIVAYNGIQARARTSSAQSAADIIIKKAEAANSLRTSYPVNTGTGAGGFGQDAESALTGAGVTLAAISAQPASPSTVEYIPCSSVSGANAVVSYWNYQTNAKVSRTIGGTCTTAAAALTGTF